MFDEYGPIMTVQDVCEELMIGKNTLYKFLKAKKDIGGFRSGRIWYIDRDMLQKYIRTESGLIPKK